MKINKGIFSSFITHWTLAFLPTVLLWCAGCQTCINPAASADNHDTIDETKVDETSHIVHRMSRIIIPKLHFRPPATIVDAVDFFKQASIDYDDPEIPIARRGLNFVLRLSPHISSDLPEIPKLTARFISLYDAVCLIGNLTQMKFRIRNNVIVIEHDYHPDSELITHRFDLSVLRYIDWGDSVIAESLAKMEEAAWKKYFKSCDVSWPDGSAIQYDKTLKTLQVTNTRYNINKIQEVLDSMKPWDIQTEIQIIAFRTKDIDRLQRQGGVSLTSLNALRDKGKTKPVASANIVISSGNEAIMKAVQEVVYPTEFSNTSNGNAGAVLPVGFEMREVGVILQTVPEKRDDGRISVMINSQWTTLDRWEEYNAGIPTSRGMKTLALRQPVFGTTSWHTHLMMTSGKTVLLGGATTPDGAWVHYGFLTATLLPIDKTSTHVNETTERKPQ